MILSQFCFCIAACDTFTQNLSCERFFIISTFSKTIENLRLHFLKIFLQKKIFFFTQFLYAKSTFNSDRRLYKKRCCDLMRTWLFNSHWRLIHRLLFENARYALTDCCYEWRYSISNATRNWTNLSFVNDLIKSSVIIWSMST